MKNIFVDLVQKMMSPLDDLVNELHDIYTKCVVCKKNIKKLKDAQEKLESDLISFWGFSKMIDGFYYFGISNARSTHVRVITLNDVDTFFKQYYRDCPLKKVCFSDYWSMCGKYQTSRLKVDVNALIDGESALKREVADMLPLALVDIVLAYIVYPFRDKVQTLKTTVDYLDKESAMLEKLQTGKHCIKEILIQQMRDLEISRFDGMELCEQTHIQPICPQDVDKYMTQISPQRSFSQYWRDNHSTKKFVVKKYRLRWKCELVSSIQ